MPQAKTNNWKLAVIKTGGKQYVVTPGQELIVEKFDPKQGVEVLLYVSDKDELKLGQPRVDQNISFELIENLKDEKVRILKFKKRKRYLRRRGHRQTLSKIKA